MAETAALTQILQKLQEMQQGQDDIKATQEALGERVKLMEEKPKVEVDGNAKPAAFTPGVASSATSTHLLVQNAKEKSLQLTFGEGECSPTALRLFLDHYNLAKNQNVKRGVAGWDDAEFRANELRYQLRGEPALWLSQENSMLSSWVADDEEIIRRLKERFMGTQSTELNIIAFEEVNQRQTESLSQYMTRCQGLGQQAFGELNEPRSTQQRIVWKFLSGVRDPEVRNAVIREKWMKSTTEAKSYDEILKIAETAKMARIATTATGRGNTTSGAVGAVSDSGYRGKVGQKRKGSDESYSSRNSTGSEPSRSSIGSNRSSAGSTRSSTGSGRGSTGNESGNFKCYYCNERSHYGGWKACPKKGREDPGWTPQKSGRDFSGKDFQGTPNHY